MRCAHRRLVRDDGDVGGALHELQFLGRLEQAQRVEQVAEFEAIMEGDAAVIDSWIAEHAPEYLTDARYLRIVQGAPETDEAGLRQEYVSSRWIEVVRPDFKQVTAAVWADVTQMIRENREAILAASLEE